MKSKLISAVAIILSLAFVSGCAKDTTESTTSTQATTMTTTTNLSSGSTSSQTTTQTTNATTNSSFPTSASTTLTTLATTADPLAEFMIENGGFETGDLSGWSILSGTAFANTFVTSDDDIPVNEIYPYQKDGTYLYGMYPESNTGQMRSEAFVLSGSGYVSFLMGGATNKGLTYISIVEEGTNLELFRITNEAYYDELTEQYASEYPATLNRYFVNLSAHLGKTVYFLIVDQATQNAGYITLDDFETYYPEIPSIGEDILATNIKPVFVPLAGTPNVLYNGSFMTGTLSGWTVVGEAGCFLDSHINVNHRLSNRPNEMAIGVLRSSAFKVGGEDIISFRLGGTKHEDLTYLSIKKVGTNEEVFRTYSDRWIEADEEKTHLYFVDLSEYHEQTLYIELVDNSREDWGLITAESFITYYSEVPSITDEIALNLLDYINYDRDYQAMRDYVDPLITGIEDETERITFEKTFYATIDGIQNNVNTWPSVLNYLPDGKTFVYTGDIHAMWLRDSSAQVLAYLQFMTLDVDVQYMVRGLLLQQFELIRRDPYANAFNLDGSTLERKFELDSLCYPLWLANEYYQITNDASIFDYFFEMTVDIVIDTLIQEQTHSDLNYRIENETDRTIGSHDVNTASNLIWSGYRPSDDVNVYKFNIPGNMFCVSTLEKMVALFETLDLDPVIKAKAETLAVSVRTAIETYGVYNDPVYGIIYAYEVTGFTSDVNSSDDKLLVDIANIPSLLSIPWIGYADNADDTYINTRAFILSDDNPYYYEGIYASGIGDPHDSIIHDHPELPVVWHMSLAMQGITSSNSEEIALMIEYMTDTTGGTYVMHEAFDASNPTNYTRDYFTWPCALYAYLYLTEVLSVNLD